MNVYITGIKNKCLTFVVIYDNISKKLRRNCCKNAKTYIKQDRAII